MASAATAACRRRRSAVIAMGKLGGREMTAGSDLDLIIVYDAAPGAEMSEGAKPLSINQYYARKAHAAPDLGGLGTHGGGRAL
jgi:glutamine synthetase adenylyltransferase